MSRLMNRGGIITMVALVMSLFHLYTGYFGELEALQQRAIHLIFVLVLVFLLHPSGKKRSAIDLGMDLLLIAASVWVGVYAILVSDELPFRAGIPNPYDLILGILAVLIVLEATRRVLGWALPVIAIFTIFYAYFGSWLPKAFAHGGLTVSRIIWQQYLSLEGIFGTPLSVTANFVVLYIIFGAFLKESGAGDFFIKLASALLGRVRGGPAKVAVVASSLFGTISGSAVANVAGVGTFTIPLMKKVGFKPHFAAAVETVSSVGGMIMPPVMGTSAFIMAEMLGISYFEVCKVAVIPAILYYTSIYFMVDLEAARTGLSGIPPEQIEGIRKVLKEGWYYLIPPLVLIYFLAVARSSVSRAAMWGIFLSALIIVAKIIKAPTKENARKMIDCLKGGGTGVLDPAIACACSGIIIGALMMTGLPMRLSATLIDLSGGSLFPLLLMTMVASLVLGTGLPVTVSYIILAIFAAPALVKVGVLPVAAHLFVLYFGVLADVTPPVALSAFAAAGIAEANAMRTQMTACRLVIVSYIVPYLAVYWPELILIGPWYRIVPSVLSAGIGIFAFAGAIQGYLLMKTDLLTRGLLLLSSILLIFPGWITDILGYAILAVVVISQIIRRRALVPAGRFSDME